ncbi:MAG: PAS domain S-box protein, partial [Myxococcales bacterium]
LQDHGRLHRLVAELAQEAGVVPSWRDIRLLTDFFAQATAEAVTGDDRRRQATGPGRSPQEREREELVRQRLMVLESMGDAFFALDRDWRFTLVNQHYERLAQRSREDTLGRVFWDLFPDAAVPTTRYYQEYHRCMSERVTVQFVDYYPTLDLWTDVRAYPTDDGGIAIFFRDVSDERRAAEALRLSEDRYRTLFESIDEGFGLIEILADATGAAVDYRFLETNPAFETQTGLTGAVGRTARELVPDRDEQWVRLYGEVAATGTSTRFEHHDPAMERWFDVYASRVGSPERRQVALVFKNISDRKRIDHEKEQLLRRESAARREAERTSLLKDEFLATISHELRT